MLKNSILKILIVAPFLSSVFLNHHPAFCSTLAAEYLCGLGAAFYGQGKYNEALGEFNKVLIIEPDNPTAKRYIDNIFIKTHPAKIISRPKKKPAREEIIERTLNKLSKKEGPPEKSKRKPLKIKPTPKEAKPKEKGFSITGETQLSVGITPQDVLWKQANADLNERNWRMLSEAAYNYRENTYDARIYDRLRVNLDTDNESGFNLHTNITIDPWSFTGKSRKITIGSGGAASDYAELELKYWSNTRYTINETVYTLEDGASIDLPEIKVVDGKTASTAVSTTWDASLTIPELKIKREFWPMRELWFDYTQPETFKVRFFPIAYQDQALTSDDPLKLSNNHIWWEESPWLERWLPGRLNSGATPVDFSPGEFNSALSFFTRDSDGTRLTALRGFSLELTPKDDMSLTTTFASPKGLWQDYDSFDNFINATRFKYLPLDNFMLGALYTYRIGFKEDEKNKTDMYNHVAGIDLGYEPWEGFKLSLEGAASIAKQDLSSSGYATESRGSAYYLSLMGALPKRELINLKYGYDELKPEKTDKFFTKYRLYGAHMDSGFSPRLSNYIETRDDTFWSRHIHFREPLKYYFAGLYYPTSKWEDVEAFRIGNGIDIGRDVLGLRWQTFLWDKTIDNLFDVRNVHAVDGKYLETVARNETTYKITEKLTTKLLALYHDLPETKAGIDPFIIDSDTGKFVKNSAIAGGKDPSLKTGSVGLEYTFTDWLALSGIWERTNDYTLAYDNYPRGNLNSTSFITDMEYGKTFRTEEISLTNQSLFPLPPYSFYDIFKSGLRLNPLENLEIYLDYTRNEFKSAGQIDDNINHIGLEVGYTPTKKLGLYTRYTYSRWNDLTLMRQGYSDYYLGHHSFFGELRYLPTSDDEFILQYGDSGRSPIAIINFDPYGGSLSTLDTRHIFRIYYRRKF